MPTLGPCWRKINLSLPLYANTPPTPHIASNGRERIQQTLIIDIGIICNPRENDNNQNTPLPNFYPLTFQPSARKKEKRNLDEPSRRVEENNQRYHSPKGQFVCRCKLRHMAFCQPSRPNTRIIRSLLFAIGLSSEQSRRKALRRTKMRNKRKLRDIPVPAHRSLCSTIIYFVSFCGTRFILCIGLRGS